MANRKDKTMTSKTVKLPDFKALNSGEIDKAIKSIRMRGKALKAFTHQTAVGFLMHYAEHGDMAKAMALADAIGEAYTKGTRTAFIEWCVMYSTLSYDHTLKALVHPKGSKPAIINGEDGSNCRVVTLFDMVRDNAKPFDFMTALASFVKRAEKAAERGEIDADNLKALEGFAKTRGIVVAKEGDTVKVSAKPVVIDTEE